jgi:hypothetical protein
MIPTAEPTPEPSQFQVQDPSMLPTSKLTPWPTNEASLLPTPVQDKSAEPMYDLILLPTLMPTLSSELSSQLSSSPSDFKSTSRPSQKPSKSSNSNDKIVKTVDEKWWPKVEKRKIMCVFSADYTDDIVRANAMFETEDDCVEYLSTLLRKHHG